jgi:hypothetical protein
MVSAFQSRELGFVRTLTKEQLDEVNFLRRGKKISMKRQQKSIKDMHKKTDLCAVHLFLNLIMGHQMKVTGTMTRWCCSLKIVRMF